MHVELQALLKSNRITSKAQHYAIAQVLLISAALLDNSLEEALTSQAMGARELKCMHCADAQCREDGNTLHGGGRGLWQA